VPDIFSEMKILTVLTYYSPHWTGLTAHAARVAEGLAARGHEVTVLTIRYRSDLPRDEMLNGVRVVRIQSIGRMSRGMITPAFPWAAANLIRQHDAVQIHTPLPEAPVVAALCRLMGRPMLMTHHGDLVMPGGAFNQSLQRLGHWLTLLAGKWATAVTSYSQDYADHSSLLAKFRHKLSYVYPPVEFPDPRPGEADKWRTQLGLTDKLIVGFAGRWVEEKGFDYLLQAFPAIHAELPNAHLLFAGEQRVAYEDFYERCLPLIQQISEHLTFAGLIEDRQRMAEFYDMCDLFALPSRTDMMALVQIESMLCGTPVVASDIPGARVVVRETGFGRLAPARDPEALASVIVSALRDRQALAPAQVGVRQVFNTERSLDQYESLLGRQPRTVAKPVNGSRPWAALSESDHALLDRLLFNEADMAFRRRARILMDYLELKDGDRVIDLGCGMGFYLMLMDRMRDLQLYGYDMEHARLQRAQAEVESARILQGDIYGLPFREQTFDKVLLSEVLEHLEQDVEALRAIRRLLKPGGLLAISVPHAHYPFWWDPINRTLASLGAGPIRRGPIVGIWTNHRRLYEPHQLLDRLVEAGFEVETIEQATHYCFPFSHFLVYGIGKPLLERSLLPESLVNSADRFRAESNSRNLLNPVNAGVAAFRAFDRGNESARVANKQSFVNVLVKARRAS
jgi:glycosyltransferase involved in cell wall biosynthesis/ubiquinone/menaquinone biosynthesis C-methylase UbiE